VFPLILRLRTKKTKRTLSIQPEKLSTQIGKLSGDVPWTKVDTLYVTDEHIFLIRKNMNGFAIPRRAFVDEGQRKEFIQLCERYILTARS
jgi:YcxB-like protein